MKKKTLLILLIVLALVGIYLYRNVLSKPADEPQQAVSTASQGEAESEPQLPSLALMDEGGSGEDALIPLLPATSPEPDGDAQADAAALSGGETQTAAAEEADEAAIDENGDYTDRDDIALYIHTYGRLPKNFMTKRDAEALGWEGGGLDDYAYGMSIGGDRFGNYEGQLPERSGRRYTECDVGTMHRSSRGAKRIVFSNDGLIYYSGDHYESFTLLYGEE